MFCTKSAVCHNNRYRQIFVFEFNFGFGSPKSDTCKVCDSNENNDEHVRRYKTSFAEQKERNLAHEGTILYINFMQKHCLYQSSLPVYPFILDKCGYIIWGFIV